MDANQLLDGITLAARQAGKIMLEADHIAESVTSKEGHANFVTKYDKRVQAELFDALSALLPEAKFIGEEDGADVFTEADRSGYVFCIDPIDGTTNFVTGYRPSVTSIALLRDGAPYLGVVYNPYADLMFSAVKGRGAACNGTPIRSSGAPLERSVAVFGTSPYYPELHHRSFVLCEYYLPRCIDLRRSGSAAWDLCNVAAGKAGMFFECRVSLWDYAAAGLIAAEAGCRLTDLDGQPLTWDGKTSMLCVSAGVAKEDYFPHIE